MTFHGARDPCYADTETTFAAIGSRMQNLQFITASSCVSSICQIENLRTHVLDKNKLIQKKY
jgi:hypothetical protein